MCLAWPSSPACPMSPPPAPHPPVCAWVQGGGASGGEVEESGWKLVSGDIFRGPPAPLSLAVQAGSGVQILVSAGITLIFAALGFLSPASRGSLLTALLVMYLLAAVAAGYTSVWLWGVLNRSYEGWHKVGVGAGGWSVHSAAVLPAAMWPASSRGGGAAAAPSQHC